MSHLGRLTLGNDETVALGNRSDVHEREYSLRFEELHARDVACQSALSCCCSLLYRYTNP